MSIDQRNRESDLSRRHLVVGVSVLLVAFGVLRIVLASHMPMVSRDAVLYCELARALTDSGSAALRSELFAQHPLYPFLIASVHAVFLGAGWTDGASLWLLSSRVVSFIGGVTLALAIGFFARAFSERVGERGAGRRIQLWGTALGALLPMNNWLSADPLSETVHGTLCVVALWLAMRVRSVGAAAACGAMIGLAYLTRLEGIILAPIVIASLFAERRSALSIARRAWVAAVLLIATVVVAAPYVSFTGSLSPKLKKQTVDAFVEQAPEEASRGALIRVERGVPESVLFAVYQTGRAGRVIIPVIGIVVLVQLRARHRSFGVLVVVGFCLAHGVLGALLAHRHGYLDPRHMLPVVWILSAPAALGIARAQLNASMPSVKYAFRLVASILAAVLLRYAVRVPNGADGPERSAADAVSQWIGERPERASALLVGGSSESRVAFYAGLSRHSWAENAAAGPDRLSALCEAIAVARAEERLTLVALTTGDGREHAGNDLLLRDLQGASDLGLRFVSIAVTGRSGSKRVHVLEVSPRSEFVESGTASP